jgi:uncharacterized protein YcgI (DUF1989 family)
MDWPTELQVGLIAAGAALAGALVGALGSWIVAWGNRREARRGRFADTVRSLAADFFRGAEEHACEVANQVAWRFDPQNVRPRPEDGPTIGPYPPAIRRILGVMVLTYEHVLPPKSGTAITVAQGERLRIVDLEGKQVVGMALFNADNPREKLSTSFSRTRQTPPSGGGYVARDMVTVGDALMSTIARPMMTIVEETASPKGVHDIHDRMCNRVMYELFGVASRDGCLELLAEAMEPWGLRAEDIPDDMDVFMNVQHDCDLRQWIIKEPVTRAGDFIEFAANMDCIVALANCPDDVVTPVNAYQCTPVKLETYSAQ